jgi:hypothetical protein
MKFITVTSILAATASAQTCPTGGVSPMAVVAAPGIKSDNVPKGCAPFEILVGMYHKNTLAWD